MGFRLRNFSLRCLSHNGGRKPYMSLLTTLSDAGVTRWLWRDEVDSRKVEICLLSYRSVSLWKNLVSCMTARLRDTIRLVFTPSHRQCSLGTERWSLLTGRSTTLSDFEQ